MQIIDDIKKVTITMMIVTLILLLLLIFLHDGSTEQMMLKMSKHFIYIPVRRARSYLEQVPTEY